MKISAKKQKENMDMLLTELDKLAEIIDIKTAYLLGRFCLEIQTEESYNRKEDSRLRFYGLINTKLDLPSTVFLSAVSDSRESRGAESTIVNKLSNNAKNEGAKVVLKYYHDLSVSLDRYWKS